MVAAKQGLAVVKDAALDRFQIRARCKTHQGDRHRNWLIQINALSQKVSVLLDLGSCMT